MTLGRLAALLQPGPARSLAVPDMGGGKLYAYLSFLPEEAFAYL